MATRELSGTRDWTQNEYVNCAIRQIFNDYGDIVSTTKKAKSLAKFGITRNADNGVRTTIADFQGTEVNETFSTTNDITHVISTSANDTGIVTIEGHYYDASNNLIFHVQNATLTGQTRVELSQALCRATRCYVANGTFASPASDLEGIVSVYRGAGGQSAGGVPTVASGVPLRVRGDLGVNQSQKCATSISSTDYWIVTRAYAGLSRGGASTVTGDVELEVRQQGGVWRPVGMQLILRTSSLPWAYINFEPEIIIPKNSDVRLVVTTNTNDTTVVGRIAGLLASVETYEYNAVS